MKERILKYLGKNILTSEFHFSYGCVLDKINLNEYTIWGLSDHICEIFGLEKEDGKINILISDWWYKKYNKNRIHENRSNYRDTYKNNKFK